MLCFVGPHVCLLVMLSLSITRICILHPLDLAPAPWDSNIKYEVIKKGQTDKKVKVGEIAVIRFKGSYKGSAFDDTFSTDQPYFYRAGVGLIVKGLDDSVVQMNVGDRWRLAFGGSYAFEKGKPSAPGKPRIPPNADIEYEVELEDIPGIADEFIADYE
jgi:FKBP-type peptidyl-prolyl cis-trans isomerase